MPDRKSRKKLTFGKRLKFFLVRMAGALFVLALGATWRLKFRGLKYEREVRKNGCRPIYAFWHGRLLGLVYAYRDRKAQIMISEHGDGEMIAQVANQLGFGSVRGSTTRGGLRALRALGRRLDAGFDAAITPDGPRGPRHVLQAGAIYMAMRSGHPLVPVTSSGWPKWTFNSWDRFNLPKPFSTLLVRLDRPMYVPPNLDEKEREKYRLEFEKQMIELVDTADREVMEIAKKS